MKYQKLTKKGFRYEDLYITDNSAPSIKEYSKFASVYNRLAELEDKIEKGLIVELPCKVGNVVYEVFKNHKPPIIQQTKIEKIIITEKGLRLKLERNSVYETSIASLGTTLFLTEEEAKRKLEELQK